MNFISRSRSLQNSENFADRKHYFIYLRHAWISDSQFFDVKRPGFQTLTINTSGVYKIELVAPGNSYHKDPGVQIIGIFELERGQRITAILGQQGSHLECGSGGSFLVLESDQEQKPLLIAGGAGSTGFSNDEEFARGNIKQAAVGTENNGTSGKQEFLMEQRKIFSVPEQDFVKRLGFRI